MTNRIVKILLENRVLTLILVLGVTLGAVFISVFVKFDFTPQAVFAGEDDLVSYLEEFRADFGYEDSMLLVVIHATDEQDVLSREILNWQIEAEHSLEEVPFVKNVILLPTLRVPFRSVLSRDGVAMGPLARTIPVDKAEEDRIRQAVEYDGSFDGYLLSSDRRMATMILELDHARRDIEGLRSAVGGVRDVLDADSLPAGYSVALCGLPALRVQVVEDLKRGQLWLVPFAGLAFLGVLVIGFRSWSGTFIPLLAVGAGLSWTVAGMVLAKESFGIINNILPVLLLTIGVSNCVHFVSRYGEEARKHSGDRLLATADTLRSMIPTCLLTYGTSAIGFLSLMAAKSSALCGLGWQACLGLLLCYISTIVVMGTLMPWFRAPRVSGSDEKATFRMVIAVTTLILKYPFQVLLATGILLAVAVLTSTTIRVNSHTMEAYPPDHPFSKQMQAVEDKLSGYLSLEVSLTANERLAFDKPEVVRKIAALEGDIAARPNVLQVFSYVDLYERAFARFSGQPPRRRLLPLDEATGRDRIALCKKLLRTVGHQSGINHFLNRDGNRARVLVRVRDMGTRLTLELIAELERKLDEIFPSQSEISYRLTGDAYLMAVAMDRFVRDLLLSLLGATIVVFGLITLLFRSIRYGLITTPPNLTPLVLTLGYMSWRNYDMNIAHVIVFAISLGVAVDDTIHFVSRFREELQAGQSVPRAVRIALQNTGRAIVFTTLVILAGLAVLSTSSFLPTRHFAELMGVTMISALIGDLLVLPVCLLLFSESHPTAKASS
jgi:predicted RND superfamily exporter protein